MAQLGFPKYYDPQTLLNTIKKIYGGSFENVNLITLTGSQKPESDVDVFVVSKGKTFNSNNGWLDLGQINQQEFEEKIKLFDIECTGALYMGEPIYNPYNLFEKYKEIIEKQPITQKAIDHNYGVAEEQKKLQENCKCNNILKLSKEYEESYRTVADALKYGEKLFTLDDVHDWK